MTKEEIIRNLKYTMEKHKNDTVNTFGTDISLMCKDILDYLEQEPCEDCISRQVVLDALDKRFDSVPMEQTTEILLLRKDLRTLPPVTPQQKMGWWIKMPLIEAGQTYSHECSLCGRRILATDVGLLEFPYCHCGAKMEVVEE